MNQISNLVINIAVDDHKWNILARFVYLGSGRCACPAILAKRKLAEKIRAKFFRPNIRINRDFFEYSNDIEYRILF